MANIPIISSVASNSMEPWHNIQDKVVMVTGASSGLGRDFCLDLAKAGCKIVAAARRKDRLVSLCDEINRMSSDNVRAVAVELDVSAKGPHIEAAVKKAWEAFGHIDGLINNAGVRGTVHSPLDLSEEEWDSTMGTNLTGTWLVSKYVCRCMRDAKQGGSIINISSIAGLDRGQLPGSLAYSASKTGVNALTKVMAIELGMYKIRVNSINPGLFRSEITEGLMEKNWLDNVAKRSCPLRTFGTADPALTRLARYLIHDSSQYVSGNIFIVDAGATLPGVPIFSSL
uniref:3-oxoacyl-[acyl-carrier-protein] reductase FabG-like n=1 Tax=Erigeron canadensis TaxID=72917 RepID=UPI001CB9C21C|nr:3-oxoacyl-[acyl-carrier-protein] reductase FabG-like [Erigeron canadensis]